MQIKQRIYHHRREKVIAYLNLHHAWQNGLGISQKATWWCINPPTGTSVFLLNESTHNNRMNWTKHYKIIRIYYLTGSTSDKTLFYLQF